MRTKLYKLSGRQLLGAVLLVISTLLWICIVAIPFLPLATTTKISAGVALLVVAEVTFYGGLILLGKEAGQWLRHTWQKAKISFATLNDQAPDERR